MQLLLWLLLCNQPLRVDKKGRLVDFRHGQPARVIGALRRQDEWAIGRYGRLYDSTIPGAPPYIWLIGSTTHLPLVGIDAVRVEPATESEVRSYQDTKKKGRRP
jgi:hypothetical protein